MPLRSLSSKRAWSTGLIVAIVLTGAMAFVNAHWPYRYRNSVPLLNKVLAGQLQIRSYHRIYFPHPGFMAEGVTLRRNGARDVPPLSTVRRILVQGRYTDLLMLRHRVGLIRVDGMHTVVPAPGSRAKREDFPPGSSEDFQGGSTIVDELTFHDALVELEERDGGRLVYPLRLLTFRNVHQGQASAFSVDFTNDTPPGRIQASGSFGPLIPRRLGDSMIAGSFSFSHADFSVLPGLSGTLDANGSFRGPLSKVAVEGHADVRGFRVKEGHDTQIAAQYKACVNGLTGDVQVQEVEAHTGRSLIRAQGAVAGAPKTTDMLLHVDSGRVQDILRPFMKNDVPATGIVSLQGHALIGPGPGDFLKRLRMEANFHIRNEEFTNAQIEQSASAFSERAQTGKPIKTASGDVPDAAGNLQAHVQVADGQAYFHPLQFQMPGAAMVLHGTFSLRDERAHMLGTLSMQKDLSHVTTGFKSFLLKPLAPFFRKKQTGAVIPVSLTGDPRRYSINSNILGTQ